MIGKRLGPKLFEREDSRLFKRKWLGKAIEILSVVVAVLVTPMLVEFLRHQRSAGKSMP